MRWPKDLEVMEFSDTVGKHIILQKLQPEDNNRNKTVLCQLSGIELDVFTNMIAIHTINLYLYKQL